MTDLADRPAAPIDPETDSGTYKPMGNDAVLRQLALRATPAGPPVKPRRTRKAPETPATETSASSDPQPGESTPGRRPSSPGTWQTGDRFYLPVAVESAGSQRLLIARWLHTGYRGRVLAEGVMIGDALAADAGPAVVETVHHWAGTHRSAIRRPATPAEAHPQVDSQEGFTGPNGYFYRHHVQGHRYRSRHTGQLEDGRGAPLVGYDMAFVLSRLARYVAPARETRHRGGFSMALAGRPGEPGEDRPWIDPDGYPRLLTRQLNDTVTLTSWAADQLMLLNDGVLPGRIVDLRHLGQALAGQSGPSFADLCYLFGVADPGPQPVIYRASDLDGTATENLLDWLNGRLTAEQALFEAMAVEVDAWRDGGAAKLRPPFLYSGGGLAAQVLDSAGYQLPGWTGRLTITKGAVSGRKVRRDPLPDQVTGAFTGAFYGGRVEATLLRWPTPAIVEDFSSNYVTVAWLTGISNLLTAEQIGHEDITEQLTAWLDRVSGSPDPVAELLDPVTWRTWGCTVAVCEPAGEWLPYRVMTAPTEPVVCFGPISSPTPLPWCWPDLAAAIVKGRRRPPRIIRAWRLTAEGELPRRRVIVPGTSVNLGEGDLFAQVLAARAELRDRAGAAVRARVVAAADAGAVVGAAGVDEGLAWRRREAGLKRLANSAAFGNLSRFDRERDIGRDDGRPTEVVDPWGGRFEMKSRWTERPGKWTFLPAASTVTAGARLVIAMAERLIVDAGGTIAQVLTDSLAIPASPTGGPWPTPGGSFETDRGEHPVRLLSWEHLDSIFARFDALRPDGQPAWKAEHGTRDNPARPLHATVFGANKYTVHNPITGRIMHGTETGLGELVDPGGCPGEGERLLDDGRRVWIDEALQAVVDQTVADVAGQQEPIAGDRGRRGRSVTVEDRLPDWARRPALSVWRASTPEQLKWLRHQLPDALPFTSFLVARPSPMARPIGPAAGSDEEAAVMAEQLGAPIAAYHPDSSEWWRLGWSRRDGSWVGPLFDDRCSTVADVIGGWHLGSDTGSVPVAHRDGRQLDRSARGVFRRLPVVALGAPVLIGREGDKMVEQARRVLVDPGERLSVFTEQGDHLGGVATELVRDLADRYRTVLVRDGGAGAVPVVPERTLREFLTGRTGILRAGTERRLLGWLDRAARIELLAAGMPDELLGSSPRGVRFEMLRRLLDDERVPGLRAPGRLAARCALPGCRQPRRRADPFCSREHEEEAPRTEGARCELPGCDEQPRPGGRFCSEAHRRAAQKRRWRARMATERAKVTVDGMSANLR